MEHSDQKTQAIGTIVAAYATRSDVGPDDIVALYRKLSDLPAQALPSEATDAGTPTSGTPGATAIPAKAPAMSHSRLTPALPLERAVTRDKVYCLCCGRGFKMLKRHLGAEHGMTEAEYRAAFNLPEDMPLVAPSYSERKAQYAKQAGFGKYDRSVLADEE